MPSFWWLTFPMAIGGLSMGKTCNFFFCKQISNKKAFQKGVSLYSEVPCIMGNGHMPPVNR